MPVGAHTILGLLAEPLKQLSESSDALDDYNISENLKEFQGWVCFNFMFVCLSLSHNISRLPVSAVSCF